MQYVRSISGSVSNTWNSINPATLSGAIDVIVVEHEDGTFACSPFHVRFGKFSLLRPHEKKVEFSVNGEKQDYPMKLGEGGEAFFVFETENSVPEALQTSPLASPVSSPELGATTDATLVAEPDPLDLAFAGLSGNQDEGEEQHRGGIPIPGGTPRTRAQSDSGGPAAGFSSSLGEQTARPHSRKGSTNKAVLPADLQRHNTDHAVPSNAANFSQSYDSSDLPSRPAHRTSMDKRPQSPVSPTGEEAMTRAINLSKKLWGSNIPSQVTEQGDLMLDMTGYKSSDDEALRAEVIARKILSEEMEGSYDIGSLIGADDKGNLWIYSSEEAKEQATKKLTGAMHDLQTFGYDQSTDALSDPGYHSDENRSEPDNEGSKRPRVHMRHDSDSAVGMSSPPYSPNSPSAGDPNRNYAKTLRLTSEQLKTLNLRSGQNQLSFTVNRATCTSSLWLWRYDVPIVISDIDGTITKSDALGHILNMIGRDWTHLGVSKLYTDIASNGYNIMYLTSRSIGQADTTRAYLAGVVQDGGFRLPKGPVILSPDRTIAALRREVYLRKPEIFKMACLRDIMALFHGHGVIGSSMTPNLISSKPAKSEDKYARATPFYAGFGNRLTDALSYRSVNIPSTRIFTINSNAEVSLDLLSLNKYKTGYASMREIVDHFFPPVSLLVKGGGEEYTDFNYWRERPLDIADFSASESEDEGEDDENEEDEDDAEEDDEEEDDEGEEDEFGRRVPETPGGRPSEDEGAMGDSFVSYATDDRPRKSFDESIFEDAEEDGEGGGDADDDDLDPLDNEDNQQGDYDRDVAESMDLDDEQKDAQVELRKDLKSLAKVLSSPAAKANRDVRKEMRDKD